MQTDSLNRRSSAAQTAEVRYLIITPRSSAAQAAEAARAAFTPAPNPNPSHNPEPNPNPNPNQATRAAGVSQTERVVPPHMAVQTELSIPVLSGGAMAGGGGGGGGGGSPAARLESAAGVGVQTIAVQTSGEPPQAWPPR